MAIALSRLISVLFHPLLILIYVFGLAMLGNPYSFHFTRLEDKVLLLMFAFFTGLFIPLVAILMMRALGLIPDLRLMDKRDRIFPFIATGIFYLWMIRNLWQNPDVPEILRGGVLGLVIALFLAFFINNFEHLSIHAVGMGNLFTFICVLALFYGLETLNIYFSDGVLTADWLIVIAVIAAVAGAVGSARLVLSRHNLGEIFLGYVIGIVSQVLAFYIMNR